MAEMPDDVTEAARVALMKAADLSLDWEALTFDVGAGKNVIAEAIMAERERCAKLADEQIEREEYGHAKHAAVTIAQNIRGVEQ